MTALWTAAEAVAATGGRAFGGWAALGISIDSRAVQPGDLFIALRGPRHDGHAFVGEALRRGACAAIVHQPIGDPAALGRLLEVDDTQRALEALGAAARRRSRARFIAVTGSVGKTGTKEALRQVLGRQGPTHASSASHNNHWGVPLSLARLPLEMRFAVLELGMNHAGEIAALTRQARPHVAVITTIAPAHIENLGSLEAIADAKAEIFEGLEADGVAVLNRDIPQFDRLAAAARRHGARIVAFGAADDADCRLIGAELDGEGSEVRAELHGRPLRYRVGLAGRHWVDNSLAVLAAVEAVGGDVAAAADALAGLLPLAGRGARTRIAVGTGTALLLDESYNANPASVRAALNVLGSLPGRRIAVLGDMLELGPDGPRLHADLAEAVSVAGVDRLFTCGPLMANLHAAVAPARRGAHAPDAQALLPLVVAAVEPGDVILVKGSLGSRMAPIVEALRHGRHSERRAG
jgi:UDP-N-acetylmuramoyl-tripeptide--D-alanyl-D-alanine ligase